MSPIDLERRPDTYFPGDEISPVSPSSTRREEMKALGAQRPSFLGGAYLPEDLEGEVEIAFVELRSTTGDVLSVRARREGGDIVYRAIDEYPESVPWIPPIDRSRQPLTLREMLRMLDETYVQEEPEVRGIAHGFRLRSNFDNDAETARELVDFVRVTSRFSPELEESDRERAVAWLAEPENRERRR